MSISEFHVSVGFYDFLMILILLVLCEFLLVLKVFRCSEKFRTSSFTFFRKQSAATQEFVADTYESVSKKTKKTGSFWTKNGAAGIEGRSEWNRPAESRL